MKVVVFDFDGVIVPSEEIKQNGYRWMFSEYGEDVPEETIRKAREEFSHARGNRYDVIRCIFTGESAGDELEEKVSRYADRFSEIVKTKIHALRVESPVQAMLERLSTTHALYINSNNPDDPLRETVNALGVSHLFEDVLGSSRTKVENLQGIARRESVNPIDIVFVGDGEGDVNAAKQFGCEFIGIATRLNGWQDGTVEFKIVDSVADLDIADGDKPHGRMV